MEALQKELERLRALLREGGEREIIRPQINDLRRKIRVQERYEKQLRRNEKQLSEKMAGLKHVFSLQKPNGKYPEHHSGGPIIGFEHNGWHLKAHHVIYEREGYTGDWYYHGAFREEEFLYIDAETETAFKHAKLSHKFGI